MKGYTTYKDSGVPWLGQIPEQWDIQKIKHCFDEQSEKGHPEEPVLCATQSQGVIPQSMYENRVVTVSKGFENLKFVRVGDFVISLRSFQGGLEYAYYQGIISAAYTVLAAKEPRFNNYYKYLFKSKPFIKLLETCVTGIREGQNINYGVLREKFIPIPPLVEQEKIVAFIDEKSKIIDEVILERKKEIGVLSELKQTQIAQVVTKGLNPGASMKDSGVPWIGMIPESWEVCRMKKVFSEAKEKTTEEGGTLLSLSQYTGVTLKEDAKKTGMFEAESTIGYNVVHKGQFVMNIMLAWNGSYAVSDYEGIISPSYCVFNFNDSVKCEKMYVHYLLRTRAYAGAFKTMSKGIIDSRLRLYPMYFLAFDMILPPIEEQRAIVDYIESKCQTIDIMIAKFQEEIDYLKEYKQRLIADAVTGAICVQ